MDINVEYSGIFKQSKSKYVSEFGTTCDLRAAIGWSMLTEVKFYYKDTYVGIVKYIDSPPSNPNEVAYGVVFRVNGDFFINMPDELIDAEE